MNGPLLPDLSIQHGHQSVHNSNERVLNPSVTATSDHRRRRSCFITCCTSRLSCRRTSRIDDITSANNDNQDNSHDSSLSWLTYDSVDDFLLQWFDSTSLKESSLKLTALMKDIFENHSNDLSLSNEFIHSMLKEDDKEEDDVINYPADTNKNSVNDKHVNELSSIDGTISDVHSEENESFLSQHLVLYQDEHYILKGLPSRPFYASLATRILLLLYERLKNHNFNSNCGTAPRNMPRPLVDATELGLTELEANLQVLDKIPINSVTKSDLIKYLNEIKIIGILEYLGLRTTIGTDIFDSNDSIGYTKYLESIPNAQQLIYAANEPCKPHSNPPRLTLAGRARAKHAHRGSKDQYFGICKGSTTEKNEAAAAIVIKMIQQAAWINVHVFGGVKKPVLEVRTKEGYGARWCIDNSIEQKEIGKEKEKIKFRGFLEPQMHDGFEKQWRH